MPPPKVQGPPAKLPTPGLPKPKLPPKGAAAAAAAATPAAAAGPLVRSLQVTYEGKVYQNAEEWAASGALKKLSGVAAQGAVAQRFSALTTASITLTVFGPATALEVTGVMAMNTPEKDKIGHVTVEHKGMHVTITDLFLANNVYWKMDKTLRGRPDVLSASRILSGMWYYWLESMGQGGRTLDGFSGRIGPMDIPSSCQGFQLNIMGLLQKKEMCGIIDLYYQKEVLFIHFIHHFLIDNNRNSKIKFAAGVLESCFAQKPNFDSNSSRADAIRTAVPDSQRPFIKFRDEAQKPGVNPNDAIIDAWFVNFNSGDRQNLAPSKPLSKEQHSFKEKLALTLLAQD